MSASVVRPLAGRRILIVEDRYLIASEAAELVRSLGAEIAGPSPTVAGAGAILDAEPVDVALLDVDLDGERVWPLAETLAARGVPFVLLTGYDGECLPRTWRTRPRLAKPVDPGRLRDALLSAAGAHAAGVKRRTTSGATRAR